MREGILGRGLVATVLICMLGACSTPPESPSSGSTPEGPEPTPATSEPARGKATGTPGPRPDGPTQQDPPGTLRLVEDRQEPVRPRLERLARAFTRYATGNAGSFPHREAVSMTIGGQAVVSFDDFETALSNPNIWRRCPAGWRIYGASSCPVDFLAPLRDTVVNDAVIVYSERYSQVVCAPSRSGPLPHGPAVILKPSPTLRTCASDFSLALVADKRGRLRSIDLTLSSP